LYLELEKQKGFKMKILFNLFDTGLGNNGGSSTIVKSANTLADLGHEVIIVDTGKNKHTWTPLKAHHLLVKDITDIPSADILIATGFKSVKSTIQASQKCGVKVHWIRGFELWVMPQNDVVDKVLRAPTHKMVNSTGLKKAMEKYNLTCELIRPGYDFDELYPLNVRDECKKPKIGALYNSGTKRKTKRVEWVFEAVKRLRENHVVDLYMFGSDGGDNSPNDLISCYVKEPSSQVKNKIYNSCDIWIAPTELEGLHIPPAEAMLTECPVVGTNVGMFSGMEDYLSHNKTGLVSENNIDSFVETIETLLADKSLRLRLGENARKEVLSLGSRKENMSYMVECFEDMIRRNK
jgi:glycosyltransferase involved in cell wall biosynthesis